MKTFIKFSAVILIFLSAQMILAQTTEFTYQGKLTDTGTQSATYDFEFRLFNVATGGAALETQPKAAVPVANNVFNVTLDFGAAVFDGTDRWLEIAVKRPADANYTTLAPRQKINSIPYSVKSKTAETAADANKLGGVAASEYVTTSSVGNSFVKNDTTQQTANFNISGNGIIGGNVGIGTTSPSYPLDANGSIRAFRNSSNDIIVQTTGGTNQWARFWMMTPNRAWVLGTSQNFNGDQFYLSDATINQLRLMIQPNGGAIAFPVGNVGIGTTNPNTRLTLNGGTAWTSNAWTASMNLQNASALGWEANASGQRFGIGQTNGGLYFFRTNSAFGTVGSPANYDMQITDAGIVSMKVLQITGGSDLAEHFELAEETVKPGMIVAIDRQNNGKLVLARGAYNRRVAGVISGANNLSAGMTLPDLKDAKNSLPVALSGRVWVYADAARNPIRSGDLLTTSDTPGYAMKVVNYRRAQGAIIGKAMTELRSGRGLVLVLVSLQ